MFRYMYGFTALMAVVLSSVAELPGQDLIIRRVDETANTVVYSIVQGHSGYIWFSGELGLIRHSGYQLDYFQHDPYKNSLSNNDAGCLHVDKDGYLWIATWGGGVNRFDPRTESFVYLKRRPEDSNSLSDNRVQNIYQDREGIFWFGTYSGGLNRYDPQTGKITRYQHHPDDPNSLSHNRVWCVTEDSAGYLWIATDNGLDRFDHSRQNIRHFRHDPSDPMSISDNRVQWLYVDREGCLWISTKNGLNRYLPESDAFLRYRHHPKDTQSLSSNLVYSLLEDRYGYLWVGTNDAGLNRMDKKTGKVKRFRHDPKDNRSISHNDIRALYEDRTGVLWIGTRGGGLNHIDLKPKKFQHVGYDPQNPNGLRNPVVTAFTMSPDGYLWIGTDGGGIHRMNLTTGKMSVFPEPGAKARENYPRRIRALWMDRRGVIWVGTYGEGLKSYHLGSGRWRHYPTGLDGQSISNSRINAFAEDPRGFLWIGTDDGLNRLNVHTGKVEYFFHQLEDSHSISHNSILSLWCDTSGVLWIGTWGGGLNRYDPDTRRFTSYQYQNESNQGLSSNDIFCVYQDRMKRLWLATRGGLNRFDPVRQTFRVYTTEHGLPVNEIWSVLEDEHSHLWISTTYGLSRFSPTSEVFRNYDADDGLQGHQFKQGAWYMSSDGRMFFGGLNGFNWFYPDSIRDHQYPATIVISGFKIFDQRHILYRLPDGSVKPIELNYDQNFFSFEFVSLDYTNLRRNQYAYQLEGFDPRWIYCGRRNYTSYTNLDPGHYLFRVKGTNSDGVWNENPIELSIHIRPPFWGETWFRIFLGALIMGIGILAYQWRLRSIKSYQRDLEHQVAERTVELTTSRNELERKNEQLQQIHRIVQSLNTQIHLEELIKAMVQETRLAGGQVSATAYVYDAPDEFLTIAAASHPDEKTKAGTRLSISDFYQQFMHSAAELYDNIFSEKMHRDQSEHLYRTVVCRIMIQNHIEGYLVFRILREDSPIHLHELDLLNDLREHIIAAFIKARLLFDAVRNNEELKKLNDAKNEFLGIAAHDLRNPLTAIIGYVDMMLYEIEQGECDPKSLRRDLQIVLRSAQQMVQLISDLLDISAIEAGKIHLELQKQSLWSVLEECEKLHQKTAHHKNISLTIEKNENLPVLEFDRARIAEVFDNLLSNAIKYTPSGGHVRLYAQENNGTVEIHIVDTGLGLTEEEIQLLFTGSRLISNKPTGGESSTGLGLIIVKKLLELHSGHIHVTSQKGVGSDFTVILPVSVQSVPRLII